MTFQGAGSPEAHGLVFALDLLPLPLGAGMTKGAPGRSNKDKLSSSANLSAVPTVMETRVAEL